MSYRRDLKAAARRHLRDGEALQEQRCYDNAAYHYGLAAECALKGALISLGHRAIAEHDAYYLHFPKLKNIRLSLSGRLSTEVVRLLAQPNFMQGWEIKMRYARDHHVTRERCELWEQQAKAFS